MKGEAGGMRQCENISSDRLGSAVDAWLWLNVPWAGGLPAAGRSQVSQATPSSDRCFQVIERELYAHLSTILSAETKASLSSTPEAPHSRHILWDIL